MDASVEGRVKEIVNFCKKNTNYLTYALLGIIIFIAYKIRVANVAMLKDQATGQYIMADPDASLFLRYAEYILENGQMAVNDVLRYYPFGFHPKMEFGFLSGFMVYLYKFLHFFDSSVTLQYAAVIYPAVAAIFIGIFFFLFVRELFDNRVALLATAFLLALPAFLYRTLSGVSDKEALGTVFLFAGLYFFIKAWKEKEIKKAILFGVIAGISSAFMGMVWGGVILLWMTVGIFGLIELLLGKFSNVRFIAYTSWLLVMTLILNFFSRYNFINIVQGYEAFLMYFIFLVFIVKFFIYKYNLYPTKVKNIIPLSIFAVLLSFIISFILILALKGWGFILGRISSFTSNFANPFGGSRWGLTVAEGKQTYVVDWFGQFSQFYSLLFLIAAVILFYSLVKEIKKYKWMLVIAFTIFIFAFVFSRYSPDANVFNGTTMLSLVVFIGSAIAFGLFFLGFLLWTYLNDKEVFEKLNNLSMEFIFVFVFYTILLVAAGSAVRLLYIFAPITAILVAYLVLFCYDNLKSLKLKWLKIVGYALIFFVILSPFGSIVNAIPLLKEIPIINQDGLLINFAKNSYYSARGSGPGYSAQWQYAMKWVKENTPENAVFAHWWDYGYWVQYGARRATLADGGNAAPGALNYYLGRYLLTNPEKESALEFLYSNQATHLLIVADEVGKYGAYSSIGSDINYDRYSWIPTFTFDQTKMQEKREEIVIFYSGNFAFDEDTKINGKVYPRKSSGVLGISIPFATSDFRAGDLSKPGQPTAYVVLNNAVEQYPLKCLTLAGNRFEFKDGLDGCLVVIPYFESSTQGNPIGSALYLSRRTKESLFAKVYIFNDYSDNFKLVYSDETNIPLANFRGMLIGPLKIWEINYPGGIKKNDVFAKRTLLDPRVNAVNLAYY